MQAAVFSLPPPLSFVLFIYLFASLSLPHSQGLSRGNYIVSVGAHVKWKVHSSLSIKPSASTFFLSKSAPVLFTCITNHQM